MIIIGLTGSMATGKSSLVSRIHKNLKWPVWDADIEVQRLYENSEITKQISLEIPEACVNGRLDRHALRQAVSENASYIKTLQSILYPYLAINRSLFIRLHQRLRSPVVVLDIPLLFENNLDDLCDLSVLVICPKWLQEQRILKRPGVSRGLMEKLLANQMPQQEKQLRADIIIDSSLSRHHTWTSFMEQVVRNIK